MLMTLTLAQLNAPPPGALETWFLCAGAALTLALLVRRYFHGDTGSPAPAREEMLNLRNDLQAELRTLAARLDAHFYELNHRLDQRSERTDERLSRLESGLERLDERTQAGV
jgi:hypothetical protein